MKTHLDWKAKRNGRFYCAPACGGRCTWAAYQKAKAESARVATLLGAGWKPRVDENLGWHWSVVDATGMLDVSSPGPNSYMTILAARYVGHGKTPQLSINAACKQAKPELSVLKKTVAVIESVLEKQKGKK